MGADTTVLILDIGATLAPSGGGNFRVATVTLFELLRSRGNVPLLLIPVELDKLERCNENVTLHIVISAEIGKRFMYQYGVYEL